MKSVQIDTKTAALCLGLTAALLTAGCNGKRTYSLGSGGGFGADGATGPAGPKGDTGPAGPAGPQGPAGPAGMAGLDGLNGLPGLAGNGLGQVTIGDRTILGQAGGAPGPLGVSVLSPTVQSGQVATVGVLSGGQVAAVALGQPKTPVDPATGPTTSPLGLTVGGHQLLGSGETNAVGLNVLSPTGASGTAVTGNLLSNGQPVAVGVTQPATGATPGAGGLVGGVTAVVGGVLPGGAPAGGSTGGGLIGGLLGGLKK